MYGSKHLSELIDLSALKIDALNIVKAPTGSGKTYFALTAIPHSIGEKALWQVVYLIDTINGKDQILRNYNAYTYCKTWDAIATGETLYWGDGDESVVIMTYAKFGQLLETRPDFHKHFKYIICDEMPSAIQYQYFEKRPNLCSIALHGLERAVRNDSTTVIALTATPNQIPSNFDAPYIFVPIDESELIHYTVDEVRKYTNLEYKKGVAFVSQKEQIDTSTPAGRFMLSVFASLAQFEREQILARQAEGIAIAKREGRMGRPEVQPCDNFTSIVKDWQAI